MDVLYLHLARVREKRTVGVDSGPLVEQFACDLEVIQYDNCLTRERQRADWAYPRVSIERPYNILNLSCTYHREPCVLSRTGLRGLRA